MIVLAITLLGLGYVVGPVMVDTFLRLRRTRTVRCPETGLVADVALDARRAALTAVPGPPTVRVRRCALWPEREDCAQRCVAPAGTS
jgi:hypothetical protein